VRLSRLSAVTISAIRGRARGAGSEFAIATDIRLASRERADEIEAGTVFVNGVLLDGAELPFGGIKRSGFGRELGRYGMDEFVIKKLIRRVR
jgi:succinate-semialdehyde dehydrogenase/glutarate-semialdehyde dehydrogenase